jgi:uncharacterized protein (TIGR02300 family)
MTESKLGTKHVCFSCGAKFYDLGKGQAVCPKCGADQKDADDAESTPLAQASRRKRKPEAKAKPAGVQRDDVVLDEGLPEAAEVLDDEDLADLDEDVLPEDLDLGDEEVVEEDDED